jgi:hypothetical protein
MKPTIASLAVLALGALALAAPVDAAKRFVHGGRPLTPPPYAAERHVAHAAFAGTPGADCSTYAWRLADALQAEGADVRLVTVYAQYPQLYDTHTFTEVRLKGRWVIQDPTFDGWWSIDGHAASAADLQAALAKGRTAQVYWHGPGDGITSYYVNPLLLFRTVTYTTPGGAKLAPRTISLPDVYYAKPNVEGATAQVMVIRGGSDWKVGSYSFMRDPGGEWVSPIGYLDGLPVSGTGSGDRTVLEVPRFPAAQVAFS